MLPGVDLPIPLTPKEEKFILEYPQCNFNAAEAAIRAGYSPKTAKQMGYKVLRKVKPILEARRQSRELALRRQVEEKATADPPSSTRIAHAIATLEQSLQLATALAFYDPRKLYEGDQIKTMDKLTRRQALIVADFQVEENFVKVGEKAVHVGYTKKVKLVDRAPYLNMLLKWHRAFPGSSKDAPTTPPGPAFNAANWDETDWEAFKRLYQKSQQSNQVIDGQSSGT